MDCGTCMYLLVRFPRPIYFFGLFVTLMYDNLKYYRLKDERKCFSTNLRLNLNFILDKFSQKLICDKSQYMAPDSRHHPKMTCLLGYRLDPFELKTKTNYARN